MNTLANVASAVCQYLPGNWNSRPASQEIPDCNFHLTREDGLTLVLIPPGWNQKNAYTTRLKFPVSPDGYYSLYEHNQIVTAPSMNASAGKPPEQIAKEIIRRILPDCERIHALATVHVARITAARDAQNKSMQDVCRALEIPVPKGRFTGDLNREYARGAGYGEFQVNNGGNVDFKLNNIPADRAVILAELFNSFFNSKQTV